jgi:hypothetical protein
LKILFWLLLKISLAKVQSQYQQCKGCEYGPGRQAALEGIHAANIKKAPHHCGAFYFKL